MDSEWLLANDMLPAYGERPISPRMRSESPIKLKLRCAHKDKNLAGEVVGVGDSVYLLHSPHRWDGYQWDGRTWHTDESKAVHRAYRETFEYLGLARDELERIVALVDINEIESSDEWLSWKARLAASGNKYMLNGPPDPEIQLRRLTEFAELVRRVGWRLDNYVDLEDLQRQPITEPGWIQRGAFPKNMEFYRSRQRFESGGPMWRADLLDGGVDRCRELADRIPLIAFCCGRGYLVSSRSLLGEYRRRLFGSPDRKPLSGSVYVRALVPSGNRLTSRRAQR